MKNNSFDAIVFDFGNVIININFEILFEGFAKSSGKSIDDVKKRFDESQIIRKYESGFFQEDEFFEAIRQILGYPYNDNEIIQIWNSLLLDIPYERMEFIKKLRSRFPVYLLSNTNEIHIKACNKLFKSKFNLQSIHESFDKAFLSYELELWKPDEAIYSHVINEINVSANKILFFDDNTQNVISAKNMGIQAIQITEEYGFIEYFKEHNPF